jgi:Ca2+-binding RTX toxin-like protein
MMTNNAPASASGCDDPAVVDDAGLRSVVSCYNSEPAGSITTATLTGDFALTNTLRLSNSNGAILVIEGGGHEITGPADIGFEVAAGVLDLRSLDLTRSTSAGQNDDPVRIAAGGSASLSNVTLDSSSPHSSSNAIRVGQGSTLTVNDSTFTNNNGTGSGINQSGNQTESITVHNSTITGFRIGIRSNAPVVMSNSTISEITQTAMLMVGSAAPIGPTVSTITNSTLTGAVGGSGTGVSNSSNSTLEIVGSTIADFMSTSTNFNGTGLSGSGPITLTGSLIGRNQNRACTFGMTVTDGGGNAVSHDCGAVVGDPAASNGLGPLTANPCGAGVPSCTETIAIISLASPAVDAWGDCSPITLDQRGVTRNAGKCDAGAYDSPLDCPTLVPDEAALIAGINCYNRSGAGDTTTLTLQGSFEPTAALPRINNPTDATLTIDGQGLHTLTDGGSFELLYVEDGDLTLDGVAIDGGGVATVIQLQNDAELDVVDSSITTVSRFITRAGANNSLDFVGSTIDGVAAGSNFALLGAIPGPSVTVTNTTFKNFFTALNTFSSLTIADSTFSTVGSAARNSGAAPITATNTTFVGNDTNAAVQSDGPISLTGVTATQLTSVKSGTGELTATGVLFADIINPTVCQAPVVDGGGNIVEGTCGAIPVASNVTAGLGSLAANPCGPGVASCTDTIAISTATNLAVDAWGTCAPVTDDQRGQPRSAGKCDAGAYESPFDCTIGNVGTEAELAAAIRCFNKSPDGATDTITLTADIALTATAPAIDNPTTAELTITGADTFAITADPNLGFFEFTDGQIELTAIDLNPPMNTSLSPGAFTVGGDADVTIRGVTLNSLASRAITVQPGANLSIIDSTLTADQIGIRQDGVGLPATISIENSTFMDLLDGLETDATVSIDRSTFKNVRSPYTGGGDLTVTNSTFQGMSPGGDFEINGTADFTATTLLSDVTFAGSGQITFAGTLATSTFSLCDATLTIVDDGGNVFNAPCGSITDIGNVTGIGTLSPSTCGPGVTTCTDTAPILSPDSQAVNAWSTCPAATTDQRGVSRTAGQCDAGAYEAFDCPTAITSEAIFRLAILCYNQTAAGVVTTLDLPDSIILTSALPAIDNPTTAALIIDGGDNTIDGSAAPITLNIQDGDLTLNNVVVDGGTFNVIEMRNDASLTVNDSVITNGSRRNIDMADQATLTLTRSTVSQAGRAGVSNADGIFNVGSGEVTVHQSSIIDNPGNFGLRSPLATITDSTIADNGSNGVRVGAGSSIVNSTLADNITGLSLEILDPAGVVTVDHVTSAKNSLRALAASPANVGSAVLTNTIIVSSSGGCTVPAGDSTVQDGGGNISDNGCGTIAATPNAASGLLALAQNPCATGVACTPTIELAETSPALGVAATCGQSLDQRGVSRPATACDAGAYELDNVAPTAADDSGFSVAEDSLAGIDIDVLSNDTDPEGPLTVTAVTGTTPATAGTVTIAADGSDVTFVPSANFNGAVSFGYTTTDEDGATDTATVNLSVTAVNDAPVANDDEYTIDERSSNHRLDVLANDTDLEADDLFLVDTGAVSPSGSVSQIIVVDNEIEFTPFVRFVGTITFDYVITDRDDFTGESATGSVTITVTDINDPPTAADDTVANAVRYNVDEDSADNVLELLANDSDPDAGDALTIASVDQPAAGGTVSISPDGQTALFTPAPDFVGPLFFDYVVTDVDGLTDEGLVEVRVDAINDAPVASDDEATGERDLRTDIFPLVNDTDIDDTSLEIASVEQPATGTTTTFGTQTIQYQPPAGFVGTVSFGYTVTDPGGLTDSGVVTVTILDVNDPPVAQFDSDTAELNSTDNRVDVLANDTDPDPGTTLTVISVEQPPNGAVTITSAGDAVLYTPAIGFVGQEVFRYTMSDGAGGTASAPVTMFVSDPNQPPRGGADDYQLDPGTSTVLTVLDNDADPEGGPLLITDATLPFPLMADATIASDGQTVTIDVDPGYFGPASFFYTVADELGRSDLVRVDLTVSVPECLGQPATIATTRGLDTLTGTSGDDVIVGTNGPDTIDGLAGNDTLCGLQGEDTITGGDGNDAISGGDDIDFIVGGEGNDDMVGGAGNDRIRGQQGNDTVTGEAGNDFLYGGTGDDTIDGGDGNDTIGGFGGADLINGGPGRDTIFGGFGPDTINAGTGNDKVFGLVGNDIIDGGPGNDILNGDNGQDTINGGDGNDTLNGGNSLDNLDGGAGDDSVNGGKANDTLRGGAGTNDTCVGNLGTDTADQTCETVFGVP